LADDLRRWIRQEPVTARPARTVRRVLLWCRRNKGGAAAIIVAGLAIPLLGIGGLMLGEKVAAPARAETRAARSQPHPVQVERDAAMERDRVHQREALIQEMQRIRMGSHQNGWRREVERRLTQADGLGGDRGALQPQAVGSLRELDAQTIKDLPYPASSL